jgi:hypothetical protein
MIIVKKIWRHRSKSDYSKEWFKAGWFLFGFIPLYIADMSDRGHSKS